MQHEGDSPDWMARMGTEALFRTLEDLSVVTSAGTGAILYDRMHDEEGKLAEELSALAVGRTLGVGMTAARRYLDGRRDGPERDPARAAYVRAYRAGDEHIAASLAALSTNPDAPMSLGIYAASVALHRLRYTFFSAHLLYQLRLRFEADTVARQMLEQIAWAVAAADLDDDLAINLLEPQKCIGRLKQLTSAAGQFYGLLSKSAHAGVGYHRAVFDVDEEDRGFIRHGTA
ncbi:hypothetical protein K0817_017685 [Microbacterium sp. HD4P20]|uniref:hypothetical protein n=1 Tax=Microbacterium sp. HD4P20 TaxID=2864874 RepID=UPI001C64246A|nr:hypothetical protein [Microbacterium sp. HD4P20]MCP2638387.1 hypothetical protein [Microbacterium sp. HD4P20]